jgi:hypothetical protein
MRIVCDPLTDDRPAVSEATPETISVYSSLFANGSRKPGRGHGQLVALMRA